RVAPMVQRVDMRAAMRVHGEYFARVADLLIDLAGLPGQVVDDRSRRRVRHPDLIVRVPGGGPRRHAHEIFDGEVVVPRSVHAGEDARARLRGYHVQSADLVVGPVRTGADDVAGHGC